RCPQVSSSSKHSDLGSLANGLQHGIGRKPALSYRRALQVVEGGGHDGEPGMGRAQAAPRLRTASACALWERGTLKRRRAPLTRRSRLMLPPSHLRKLVVLIACRGIDSTWAVIGLCMPVEPMRMRRRSVMAAN